MVISPGILTSVPQGCKQSAFHLGYVIPGEMAVSVFRYDPEAYSRSGCV